MQVGTYELTEEWTDLATLTKATISAGDEYHIQNRGSASGVLGVLIVCEGDTEPTDNEGEIVMPSKKYEFTKGTQEKLYLRSESGTIKINVTQPNAASE